MTRATYHSRLVMRFAAPVLALTALGASALAQDSLQQYTQTNLVSNQSGAVQPPDFDLVNSWGLARTSSSPWWVADNGTGKSTLYDGLGNKQARVVTIPSGDPTVNPMGTPTGAIYNGSALDFLLAPGKPAVFLFVTEDGTISGWNPGVNPNEAKR